MRVSDMHHIPLKAAFLCVDCESLGSCSTACPCCSSRALLSLAGVLNRASDQPSSAEVARVLERIEVRH